MLILEKDSNITLAQIYIYSIFKKLATTPFDTAKF